MNSRKIVINACYGGFGLSHEAVLLYLAKCGKQVWVEPNERFGGMIPYNYYLVPPEQRIPAQPDNWHDMTMEQRSQHNRDYSAITFYDRDIARDDPHLVAVVEELGSEAASDRCAELKVVSIPEDVDWEIDEYDGLERVEERHRSWS